MQLEQTEKWWDTPLNKRIGGARGSRVASPRLHMALIGGLFAAYFWLTSYARETDAIRALPPPPCPPPPPSREALSSTVTTEIDFLKRVEVEGKMPEHVPQKRSLVRQLDAYRY